MMALVYPMQLLAVVTGGTACCRCALAGDISEPAISSVAKSLFIVLPVRALASFVVNFHVVISCTA